MVFHDRLIFFKKENFARLPPKLHILFLAAIQRSSQGAQGLSV